jgi:hypothetical protein
MSEHMLSPHSSPRRPEAFLLAEVTNPSRSLVRTPMDMQVKILKMFFPNSPTALSVMERSDLRMELMSSISRITRAFLRARAAGGRRTFTRLRSRFLNPLALEWLRFSTPTSSPFP